MKQHEINNILQAAYPEKNSYRDMPHDKSDFDTYSIEDGYFVFTMMPSLRCDLNCPHCYLTLDQRRNSPTMSVEKLLEACQKVDDYYETKGIEKKTIIFYWYGGEPTQMGQKYFLDAFDGISKIFSEEKGYYIRHDILTSLLNIDESWFDIFSTYGRGHFQTSFDGLMRGKGYIKKWDKMVRKATQRGLSVSTISVVNNELFKFTPKELLDYLIELEIEEASFLPFMLNEQNSSDSYEKFAPPMNSYSEFMIELTDYWYKLYESGIKIPSIGQHFYTLDKVGRPEAANIAGQTMFLLPDGDFVLPDYKDGYLEYMKPFGNIFKETFNDVLTSKSRRNYIRKQYTRNYNSECISCTQKNHCIMEFWKPNREGDDCFGAKKYIEWVHKKDQNYGILDKYKVMLF